MRKSIPWTLAGAILVSGLSAYTAASSTSELRIDPLLLAEAEAVWELVASPTNPLWPGWNAADTPILIYVPGEQDVLINHPDPPEGFAPYSGPLAFPGGEILLRDGPTLIEWDGQNTSIDVNGIRTLVVADTLSNRKQALRGWMNDPRPIETKLAELEYSDLRPDPYEQMSLIVHEAFHVFQDRSAPDKGADERNVRVYPCLDADNNVGFALEGAALADAMRAEDPAVARAAAIRWLAVRSDRRASLPSEAVVYEDGNEFGEGLAMYVELKLARALEGRRPVEDLWWAQGFHGFDDLTGLRERRIEALLGNMRGEVNVNNDPYGTSPLRGRLYYSGMAIAAILDRFDPGWQSRIFEDDATLTGLARQALSPNAKELEQALADARKVPEYAELVASKTRLEAEGHRDTAAMLASIESGPNTSVIVDHKALGDARIGLSFTPFGVRALDADRTIYTLVPIEARIGSEAYGFKQSIPTPTLEDRSRKFFQFQLPESIDVSELAESLGSGDGTSWNVEALDLDLGGVRLHAPRAAIEHRGATIHVRYLPRD